MFSQLTGVCDHANGTVASWSPSFGLNEVGTTVKGVSALRLCTVRPLSWEQWSFQHGDAFTCIGRPRSLLKINKLHANIHNMCQ